MAFLTIAGVAYDVQTSGAGEQEPVRVGGTRRTFTGRLRSTVRAEFRRWSFALAPLVEDDYQALRAACAPPGIVTVGGDAIGAVRQAYVEVHDAAYHPDDRQPEGFVRVASITIEEV